MKNTQFNYLWKFDEIEQKYTIIDLSRMCIIFKSKTKTLTEDLCYRLNMK